MNYWVISNYWVIQWLKNVIDRSQFLKSNSLFHLVNNVSFFFPFSQPSFLRKPTKKMFFFLSCSGTTFENTVSESSPQNVSTGKLNLVLIVIVLLAIFVVAIAVVFGMSFFRRNQGHKNQGKFLELFECLLLWKLLQWYDYLDIRITESKQRLFQFFFLLLVFKSYFDALKNSIGSLAYT